MPRSLRLVILATVVVLVAAVLWLKPSAPAIPPPVAASPADAAPAAPAAAAPPVAATAQPLPRVVDLGAGACIPCRQMAPILDQLRRELAGQVEVQFIDVWKDPQAGRAYGIRLIPTQIFYDASGKELSRHEGFMGRQEILQRLGQHGIEPVLAPAAAPEL